jgi:hypothetical protein
MFNYRTDIWQIGLIAKDFPAAEKEKIRAEDIAWLPQGKRFTFLADPFVTIYKNGFCLFAEAYDYRDKKGWIEGIILDEKLAITERFTALREEWHLSYPFIFNDGEKNFLLPEAHKSKTLTLYVAEDFPKIWRKFCQIELGFPVVDATVFFDGEIWWLFFSPADSATEILGIAYAYDLKGPWKIHPKFPARSGKDGSRPGGAPFLRDGILYLPVQDCRKTYGGALGLLRFNILSKEECETELLPFLAPENLTGKNFSGLHHFSGCKGLICIDAKTIDASPARFFINLQKRLRRLMIKK